MTIVLMLTSYFNITSFETILQSNVKLKNEAECDRIKNIVISETEKQDLNQTSVQEKISEKLAETPYVLEVEINDGNSLIYSYRAQLKRPKSFENGIVFSDNIDIKNYKDNLSIKICTDNNASRLLLKINIFFNIFFITLFLCLSYIAISSWISNALEKPLRHMFTAQEKLANGEFDVRIQTQRSKNSEIIRISSSFNRMAEELDKFKKELEEKNDKLKNINIKYKNLNEQLEIEIKKKTQELREFFSLITHDLKVPLAAVQGYASLLLKEKNTSLSEKQAKFIKNIAITNMHMTHLVRNLIDSFKYESGKAKYFFHNFPLCDISEEIYTNISLLLEEKNITLTSNIQEFNAMVYGDKIKIVRVILNLLSNAIKISEEGGEIKLWCEETKDKVLISVTDTGKGIKNIYIKDIFKKFAQFPYNDKTTESTGLGLYIVKQIIEGHNQQIDLETEDNIGTTFRFSLDKASSTTNE